jgi:hypothetical protein
VTVNDILAQLQAITNIEIVSEFIHQSKFWFIS